MVNAPVNATGWNILMDGKMVEAVYTMFDASLGGVGLFAVILFAVYQFMLFQKTKNLTAMWVIGVIFLSLYGASKYVEQFSLQIMLLIITFEFAGILYLFLFAKQR